MDDGMFIINLRLGDSRYSIKVKREDEDLYRIAAEKANNLLSEFSLTFSDITKHNLLGMVTLQLAYECEAMKKAKNEPY